MLTLSGNNLYSGGTTVTLGTLQVGNGGSTGSLTVRRRLARGGFARPKTYILNHPFPSAAGIGDVTGDGRNDAVVSGNEGWPASTLMVLAQNRAGTLEPPTSMPAMENSHYVVVRDMNRDGRQDVVVFHEGRIGVFLQRPGGGLLAETLYAMPTGGPTDTVPGRSPRPALGA